MSAVVYQFEKYTFRKNLKSQAAFLVASPLNVTLNYFFMLIQRPVELGGMECKELLQEIRDNHPDYYLQLILLKGFDQDVTRYIVSYLTYKIDLKSNKVFNN